MHEHPARSDEDQPKRPTALSWLTSGLLFYLRVCLVLAFVATATVIVFAATGAAQQKLRALAMLAAGGGMLYLCCRELEQILSRLPDAAKWWWRTCGPQKGRNAGRTTAGSHPRRDG